MPPDIFAINPLWLIPWWILGIISFVYWWTKDHSLTWCDLLIGMVIASGGPLMWFMGWLTHGEPCRVILPKRNKKI